MIEKLLDIASAALAPELDDTDKGPLMKKLVDRDHWAKNGFYAFESALLVRPFSSRDFPLGVLEWNDPIGWKSAYDADLSQEIFFSEDVFGEQFSLRETGIFKFNPETGAIKFLWRILMCGLKISLTTTHFIRVTRSPVTGKKNMAY